MNSESRTGYMQLPLEFQDSDCEDKSLSQADSLDGISVIICGENFNTLKKAPYWNEKITYKSSSLIEQSPEFQDRSCLKIYEKFAIKFADYLLKLTFSTLENHYSTMKTNSVRIPKPANHILLSRNFWSPEFLTFSPLHSGRPSSRSSLGSSRLSSSHSSLSDSTTHRVDDSSFITRAVSHDTLTTNQKSKLYNVLIDSDVFAISVDTVKPPLNSIQNICTKKRRRNSSGYREYQSQQLIQNTSMKITCSDYRCTNVEGAPIKRHSVVSSSTNHETEPIHMILQEVRQYLQTLYSSPSDSLDQRDQITEPQGTLIITNSNKYNANLKTSNLSNAKSIYEEGTYKHCNSSHEKQKHSKKKSKRSEGKESKKSIAPVAIDYRSDIMSNIKDGASHHSSGNPRDIDDNEIDINNFYGELNDVKLSHLIESLNSGSETRLPFKKRRVSVNVNEVKYEPKEVEISYPATPMMSIAELVALRNKDNSARLCQF